MGHRARGGLVSGGADLSWAPAALHLRAGDTQVFPRRVGCRVLPPVEIRLDDITAVETDFGVTGGIRFRLSGPADGIVFWVMGSTKGTLIDALRRAGLEVE